jgi:hypothetical protein
MSTTVGSTSAIMLGKSLGDWTVSDSLPSDLASLSGVTVAVDLSTSVGGVGTVPFPWQAVKEVISKSRDNSVNTMMLFLMTTSSSLHS